MGKQKPKGRLEGIRVVVAPQRVGMTVAGVALAVDDYYRSLASGNGKGIISRHSLPTAEELNELADSVRKVLDKP